MDEYHKILTVYERDPETKFRTLIEDKFACPEFEYLKDSEWIFEEKIDGTNIRVMWRPEKSRLQVSFGGKTDNAQIPAFLFDKLMKLFPEEKMIDAFPEGNACLYGEGYGAKIQKGGGNYIPYGCDFILFDVKIGDFWLRRDDVRNVADKLGIRMVPEVTYGNLGFAIALVKRGLPSRFGDFQAEGFVMRPKADLFDRQGKRIIAKIKCKDFK